MYLTIDEQPGMITRRSVLGRVLSTADGKTLYAREGEKLSMQVCASDCLSAWTPVAAPAASADANLAGWSIVLRSDGSRQWAYGGHPLYTYVGDTNFGDQRGATQANWRAVVLRAAVTPPAEIDMGLTADGEVFTERSSGKTLYRFHCMEDAADHLFCDTPETSQTYWRSICGTPEQCAASWRPVRAPRNAKPVGALWSVVYVDPTAHTQFAAPGESNGVPVWAYKGRPLYTYSGDLEPGDMEGQNTEVFYTWGYTMAHADGGGYRLQ